MPEIFQRMMPDLLGDLDQHGIICRMDDILIHDPDTGTHNKRVRQVFQKLSKAGLTLNAKCEFSKNLVKFLGHAISRSVIEADLEKMIGV